MLLASSDLTGRDGMRWSHDLNMTSKKHPCRVHHLCQELLLVSDGPETNDTPWYLCCFVPLQVLQWAPGRNSRHKAPKHGMKGIPQKKRAPEEICSLKKVTKKTRGWMRKQKWRWALIWCWLHLSWAPQFAPSAIAQNRTPLIKTQELISSAGGAPTPVMWWISLKSLALWEKVSGCNAYLWNTFLMDIHYCGHWCHSLPSLPSI